MRGIEPTVSIVIPCYQQGHYLAGSVESALGQGDRAIEVIVVDDGSTDSTAAVSSAFADRIRYIRQENRGLSAARNRGIQAARGTWIQLLDADDLLEPGKCEHQSRAGDAAGVDIVYGPYQCFRDEHATDRFRNQPAELPEPDSFRSLLLHWERGFCVPIHAFLFRRDCFSRWGVFDERLPNHEDWDRHLRFAAAGARFLYAGGPHALYRLTRESMSRGSAAAETMRSGKYQCLAGLLADGKLSPEQRELVRQRYVEDRHNDSVSALRNRQWRLAARQLWSPAGVQQLRWRAKLSLELRVWRQILRRGLGAVRRRLAMQRHKLESATP